MSDSEQEPQVGQGGGTGGLTGTELSEADETIERPDLVPDAWDAKPADEEPHHTSRSAPDSRGGEGEGSTAGGPPPGSR